MTEIFSQWHFPLFRFQRWQLRGAKVPEWVPDPAQPAVFGRASQSDKTEAGMAATGDVPRHLVPPQHFPQQIWIRSRRDGSDRLETRRNSTGAFSFCAGGQTLMNKNGEMVRCTCFPRLSGAARSCRSGRSGAKVSRKNGHGLGFLSSIFRCVWESTPTTEVAT